MSERVAPGPRRGPAGSRLQTLPERIATDVGVSIARGTLAPGQRLREVEIAASYNVSRAPVREAIRILAKRGLVNFTPRHGAFVVALTIEKVIDVCNSRSLLYGLAARYFAYLATQEGLDQFAAGCANLETLAADPNCEPGEFSFASSRVANILVRHCGSESVAELIAHQVEATVWTTFWRFGPLDFVTQERRREWAAQNWALHGVLAARDAADAEQLFRSMMDQSARIAVAALSELKGEPYEARRLNPVGEA